MDRSRIAGKNRAAWFAYLCTFTLHSDFSDYQWSGTRIAESKIVFKDIPLMYETEIVFGFREFNFRPGSGKTAEQQDRNAKQENTECFHWKGVLGERKTGVLLRRL